MHILPGVRNIYHRKIGLRIDVDVLRPHDSRVSTLIPGFKVKVILTRLPVFNIYGFGKTFGVFYLMRFIVFSAAGKNRCGRKD
jgi:hypothetical protein